MLLDDPGPPAPPPPTPPPGPNPPAPHVDANLQAVIASFAAQSQSGAAQVQKVIDDLRTENAGHRTTNRDLSGRWTKLAESVGLTKEATPDQVAEKIAAMGGEVRAVKVDREIEKAAAKHKADPELVAALIARDKVAEGVEEAKLAETLDAKVKEYVDSRPALRIAADTRRSGPPIDPADPTSRRKGLGGALDQMMGLGV